MWARKQNKDYAKQHHTPHCWMPAKVMYPTNLANRFSWLTRSTKIFIVGECSDIYIYISEHFTVRTPLRKDTGVFKSFGRFIGLKCHNYALCLCFVYK